MCCVNAEYDFLRMILTLILLARLDALLNVVNSEVGVVPWLICSPVYKPGQVK